MKNIITFLLYCLSVTALIAQVNSKSQLQVLSTTPTETTLRLTLSGVVPLETGTPAGPASIITIENGTPILQKGAPDLPKYAAALRIPNTGNMAIEVIAAEYDDLADIDVAPSKGNLKRTVNPADIPFEYGPAYQLDQFFPGPLAEQQTPFVFRSLRGQALWLYPVQYNPVQKVLRVYRSITLRVYHVDGPGENELTGGPVLPESLAFEQLYRRFFVNADAITSSRGNSSEPDRMLVIAPDALLEELQPLVDWKRQMGIHTTVVPVSAIGSSESGALYDFVRNYYAEHGITYLLLVGDENALKPILKKDGESYSCDNCFGYMTGDDHLPEILVGRLHASTPKQLRIMVNRNLEYEKHPQTDSTATWYATGMASCSNEGAGIGDDGQADWQQGNEWKSAHIADGFTQYWEFYDGSHGADSPTPGDVSADQTGNPTNGPIVNLMNTSGVSLYNYTGHGWEQGLVSGNFTTTAVDKLRNTHRYPIIIAVACCAGNYTNGECLGEAWQRAGDAATGEPWGGIAGFFSSDYQSWSPPMEGQDGMNQYLVDADGIDLSPTLAGMLAYGNAKMIAAYGSNGEIMADFWNPFAEPSTTPRTRFPQLLTASHPDSILFETNSLMVACPVEGALVSLYWQNQTWAVARVENGMALLDFAPLNNIGQLTVTVSQFNYIPYQGTVTVLPATQPFIIAQDVSLDDSPAGNSNQRADFGEACTLQVNLQNIGMSTATNVTATLTTNNQYLAITSGQTAIGNLNGSDSAVAFFALQVNPFVPNGYLAICTLTVHYSDSLAISIPTPIRLYAPSLETMTWTLDDTAAGNGNGYLESGETAVLRIGNRNTGGSDSPVAFGTLTANSPYLTISAPVQLGVLNAASNPTDAVFQIQVSPDAPKSQLISLHYALVANPYGAEKNISPIILNPILETFESNNFNSFNWELSGNKPWSITTIGAYNGQYCSRSGAITHKQHSTMELSLEVSDEGLVAFARRVSSEEGYDFLRFYIDSVEMGAWSGEVPWGEVMYPVAPGQHTFTWTYEKDDLKSSGADRAWIDEIILPPHQIVVGTEAPVLPQPLAFTVYPNPSDGPAIVMLESVEAQTIVVQVFDNVGRLVRTAMPALQIQAGRQSFPVDLTNCPSGVYFIRLQGEKVSGTQKMVKK